MCTVVRITFIGLFFLGFGTSSDAEPGSNHRKETKSLVYGVLDNSTILFYEDRNGSNILALPINYRRPKDVLFLYNTLTELINKDGDVVVKNADLARKLHGYHVVNDNWTIPFNILVTEKQERTVIDRILTEFAKDESIINKLYNHTIYKSIDLQVALVPRLIIPGCENITLKYFNLVQKFVSFKEFYTHIQNVCAMATIPGSLLICGSILKYKRLQTPPNVYAFSLAIAVVLQYTAELIRLILSILEMSGFWYITELVMDSSFTCGIFTSVGITIDRYIAICYPSLRCRISTNRRAVQINVTIWALSLTATLIEEVSGLLTQDNIYFDIYSIVLFIVIPMCIILLLYICITLRLWKSSKMKQSCSTDEQPLSEKSISIAAVIATEYVLCWAPFGLYTFLMKIIEPFKYEMFCSFVVLQIFILGCLLNPLLYPLVSKDFRKAYKDLTLLCIGYIRRRLGSGKSPRHGESNLALHAIDGESRRRHEG